MGSSVPFSRFHLYALVCNICFSVSDLLPSVWQTLGPPTSLQMTWFCSFLWLSDVIPHFAVSPPIVWSRPPGWRAHAVVGWAGQVSRPALPGLPVHPAPAVHRGGAPDHALPPGRCFCPGGPQQPAPQRCGCRPWGPSRLAREQHPFPGRETSHPVGVLLQPSSDGQQPLQCKCGPSGTLSGARCWSFVAWLPHFQDPCNTLIGIDWN